MITMVSNVISVSVLEGGSYTIPQATVVEKSVTGM